MSEERMTLSQMRQVLDGRGIKLTKSLGQNFLHDGNQLRRIVAAAELSRADKILEIGPGLGPLTELLLADAGEVLAIEKDARLVEVLREQFASTPRLQLLQDDAVKWLRQNQRDWAGWKLVANLPYSVASPILVELAQSPRPPDRMVVTLQAEVAQRLAAQAGGADYGVMSLLVQFRYEPHGLFKIPATCFFPAPDVASACICLDRRQHELLPETQRFNFVRLVKQAFSQRRKVMLKVLKVRWPEQRLLAAFQELKISLQTRAEGVSLAQFVRLSELLNPKP
jgi:16S rRNA (adenine1518-N6/adenine1519-N6)-dimethyltransferase